jgi:hypothetical protein
MLTRINDFDELRILGHRETVVLPELRTTLPAFIHSAGFREDVGPTAAAGKTGVELAIVQHTLSGRGKLSYRGSETVVEPGQTLLLCYPHEHLHWAEAGDRWEYFYIALGGHEAVRGIREIVDRAGPILRFGQDSLALVRAADACVAAIEGSLDSPYRASELAYGIVMGLLSENVAFSQKTPGKPASVNVPAFIPAVEEFCRLNFARPIGVDDMARVANMSRFHFSRVFEKARGTPP